MLNGGCGAEEESSCYMEEGLLAVYLTFLTWFVLEYIFMFLMQVIINYFVTTNLKAG